jgi:hypothetical protein
MTTAPPPSSSHIPFAGSAEELGTILKDYPDIFCIQKQEGGKEVSLNKIKHKLACGLLDLASNITISETNR